MSQDALNSYCSLLSRHSNFRLLQTWSGGHLSNWHFARALWGLKNEVFSSLLACCIGEISVLSYPHSGARVWGWYRYCLTARFPSLLWQPSDLLWGGRFSFQSPQEELGFEPQTISYLLCCLSDSLFQITCQYFVIHSFFSLSLAFLCVVSLFYKTLFMGPNEECFYYSAILSPSSIFLFSCSLESSLNYVTSAMETMLILILVT
jgi:hypothetical protein